MALRSESLTSLGVCGEGVHSSTHRLGPKELGPVTRTRLPDGVVPGKSPRRRKDLVPTPDRLAVSGPRTGSDRVATGVPDPIPGGRDYSSDDAPGLLPLGLADPKSRVPFPGHVVLEPIKPLPQRPDTCPSFSGRDDTGWTGQGTRQTSEAGRGGLDDRVMSRRSGTVTLGPFLSTGRADP